MKILKAIYLMLCVIGFIGFVITIEALLSKYFYIPLIFLCVCVLNFFAAVPYINAMQIRDVEKGDEI